MTAIEWDRRRQELRKEEIRREQAEKRKKLQRRYQTVNQAV